MLCHIGVYDNSSRKHMIRLSKFQSAVVYLRHYIQAQVSPIIFYLRKRHTDVFRHPRNVILVCDYVNGTRDGSQRNLT